MLDPEVEVPVMVQLDDKKPYVVIRQQHLRGVGKALKSQSQERKGPLFEATRGKHGREHESKVAHLDFLAFTYTPEFWYWEVVECARRLLLTSVNVFFAEAGPEIQTIINLFIALVFWKTTSLLQPYVTHQDEMLNESMQILIVLSFVVVDMIIHGIGGSRVAVPGWIFMSLQILCVGLCAFFVLREFLSKRDKLARRFSRTERRPSSESGPLSEVGQEHGQGTSKNPNGSKSEAEWKNDKRHVQSKMTNRDARKYVGKSKNGLIDTLTELNQSGHQPVRPSRPKRTNE